MCVGVCVWVGGGGGRGKRVDLGENMERKVELLIMVYINLI